MRRLNFGSLILAMLLPMHVYAAPPYGRLELKLDSHGDLVACESGEPAVDENAAQSLVVSVVDSAGTSVASPHDVSFTRAGAALGVLPKPAPDNLVLAGADLTGTIIAHANGKSVTCNVPAPAPSSTASPPGAGDGSQAADQLVSAAREYLEGEKIFGHVREGDTLKIYHLPDGRPAFPIPAHISESVKLRLIAVVPREYDVAFEVTTCEDVPNYRILGSFTGTKSTLATLQGAEMREVSHVLELSCSGTLTYNVELRAGGSPVSTRTISIKLDPVYRFSWGVALVFDFGNPPRLSLGDRASDNDGSEKFIARDVSLTGAKPLVSLTLHLCEANPYDWRFSNWWNLFLALDPTRLSEGFAAGLNLKPVPQVGLLFGLSVFQSMTLDPGVKQTSGDAWTATGALPTKKVFDGDSVGLLVGVEVGLDVFNALVK